MTKTEKLELRTELEELLTGIVNNFQVDTGLIVDDLSLTFEGVRVDLSEN